MSLTVANLKSTNTLDLTGVNLESPFLESSLHKEVELPLIICVGDEVLDKIKDADTSRYHFLHVKTAAAFVFLVKTWKELNASQPEAIFIYDNNLAKILSENISKVRDNSEFKNVPFIVFSDKKDEIIKKVAHSVGVDDYFYNDITFDALMARVRFCKELKSLGVSKQDAILQDHHSQEMYLLKRLFDIAVSGTVLLLLSPILLLIALIVKLESRGPIFYISKRAGTNYQVFDFYKFRSMCQDADSQLAKLKETSNQYKDGNQFVKIQNDPRITRFGNFIRKTSLDELPQLFNVLKGDMSIVGNRPLPLYEAELLTTDDHAERFLGPAGITGLWQALKRGKGDMSSEERITLDRIYVRKNSLLFDFKIILMTFPALLQSEKV